MKYTYHQQGYIALMSTIIISALLLMIAISIGFNGFFGRLNILDSEAKAQSRALAQSCADIARLHLLESIPNSPEPVPIGGNFCTIISVTSQGNQTTIKTQAIVNRAYTNIKILLDNTTSAIILQEECANFDATCT